ncbi:MAG: polymorphic toxin type 44 domain-containing protein [Oscillospiraceae bacterium]|nr:polymorphic toxin type 44 domain-containing protein [Oscillospiraceae bacterium]WMJ83367.1 polymorphic toxin type 44 domain-containing protein [Oscillospiraceae bacterium MB24-C1]
MGAAKELDRFLHTNLHGRIPKYFKEIPIEDITDRLHKLMASTDATYAAYTQAPVYQNALGTTVTIENSPVTKLKKFIASVKDESPTDIKRSPEWDSKWYIYEGDIVKKDATGNILFGYVGKVFGYDDEFLCLGAGLYQIWTGPWRLDYATSYGDDPYDTKMIRKGIAYYNKTH